MSNRRQSRMATGLGKVLAWFWQARFVLLIALSYLLLFGWLFSEIGGTDTRMSEVLVTPENPIWEKPDGEHWFGTTGTGADLFVLSRAAMANSAAVAVIAGALGTGLGLLLVLLFAFDPGERRFSLLQSAGRVHLLLPAGAALVIVTGGSGGGIVVMVISLAVLVALHLAPVIANWFEEGERRSDIAAAYVVGLTRPEIVSQRIVPVALRKLVGVFAGVIPPLVLSEMALSFLGFGGNRLSCGSLVAYGQGVIIEAPWMAVCPGILATAIVLLLSLLGWLASLAMRPGLVPRFL